MISFRALVVANELRLSGETVSMLWGERTRIKPLTIKDDIASKTSFFILIIRII